MTAAERHALAVKAIEKVAVQHGLKRWKPIVLQDRNHTIVHLSPLPIVAKVSVGKRLRPRSSSLDREVRVAELLVNAGAPVVRPCTSVPPGPYAFDGTELSLWDYYSRKTGAEPPASEIGSSLRLLHERMLRLREDFPALPPFTLQIEEANELLGRSHEVAQLAEEDRLFLRDLFQTTMFAIRSSALDCQPLHGECNPFQTILTSSGLLWLDFEAACLGPIEWDLANIDSSGIEAYGRVNQALQPLIRTARRLCTVTWCWSQFDRAAEIREAAAYHLESLKHQSDFSRLPKSPPPHH